MKIAIDFDDVIVERGDFPRPHNFVNDEPVLGAREALHWLKKEHDIYIFTNRVEEEWDKISEWLRRNGFPEMRIGNIKEPETKIYLDDRAVRFTNWDDFCKLVG